MTGCSAARSLAKAGHRPTVIEMGRGLGGRMATRRSLEAPNVAINHGAPGFDANAPAFLEVLGELKKQGYVDMFARTEGCYDALSKTFEQQTAKEVYVGTPGMSAVCEGLVQGVDVEFKFRSMAKEFQYCEDQSRWTLRGRDGEHLGDYDWLLVTSSSVVHKRWTKIYGGPPPLAEAARALSNPSLNETLDSIDKIEGKPVFVAMQAFEHGSSPLENLPADLINVSNEAVVAKIVRQRPQGNGPTLDALVVHSTHDFALASAMTHGRGGTAEAMGARSDANDEKNVMGRLMNGLEETLKSLGITETLNPSFGPVLHRWGAAFPEGCPSTVERARIHAQAKLAFAGDFLAQPGGSVEQAFLSGSEAAAAIMKSSAS